MVSCCLLLSCCSLPQCASSHTVCAHTCITVPLQVRCGINVLPVEVLSKVLQRVDLQQRLHSCSVVCSQWRKAAAMSITAIDVPECNQDKATSLSDWLSAHAADVKLCSISVKDLYRQAAYSSVILPLQQLTALQTLQLQRLEARTADEEAAAGTQGGADGDADHAILMSALPGLTRLDLYECEVRGALRVM